MSGFTRARCATPWILGASGGREYRSGTTLGTPTSTATSSTRSRALVVAPRASPHAIRSAGRWRGPASASSPPSTSPHSGRPALWLPSTTCTRRARTPTCARSLRAATWKAGPGRWRAPRRASCTATTASRRPRSSAPTLPGRCLRSTRVASPSTSTTRPRSRLSRGTWGSTAATFRARSQELGSQAGNGRVDLDLGRRRRRGLGGAARRVVSAGGGSCHAAARAVPAVWLR
mmetsp:Transcript_4469/g.11954  ORF Transcript_4469/g.11954 Transcript_4469/m.11954 type:complete len:232 (-) Transcript_4469:24-719(-)